MQPSDFGPSYPGELVPARQGVMAFIPHRLPVMLSLDSDIRKKGEAALLALGRLQASIPAMLNPALITAPFMRREAVLSSKIEGTHTELAGLYLFEELRYHRSDGPVDGRSDTDAQEVFNYVRALEIGLEMIGELPVGDRVLCEMHRRLMDQLPEQHGFDKVPGEFRRTQAFIGRDSDDIRTARYVAPPPDQINRLMRELGEFINSPNGLSSLESIALAHYQFEAIHPFFDGNGRIGRLLISLMLASTGVLKSPLLYLSAYFQRNKQEYMDRLLRVSTHGDWSGWVLFFLTGVETEADDAARRAQAISQLRESYRSRFQSKGSAKVLELVDDLFHWPLTTVARAQKALGMSHNGASRHIRQLEQAGVLQEVTGYKRNRLFIAKEIIQIVQ